MRYIILICAIPFIGCSDSNQGLDEQSMQAQQAQYQAYLDHYDQQNMRTDIQLDRNEKKWNDMKPFLKDGKNRLIALIGF